MIDVKQNMTNFIDICKENIDRPGLDELLEDMKINDFFIAPCSTKYHLSERGGLCKHSLNVYSALVNLCTQFGINIVEKIETITIISLFHDLCKMNFYKIEMKPVKEGQVWVQKPQYVIDDEFPVGHGEKSVIRLLKYMKLTDEEIYCIRWHMGAWDNAVKGGERCIDLAQSKSSLVTLLQCADMIASQILEK